MNAPKNTVERIHPEYFLSKEKYLLLLRHIFAYEYVIDRISNNDRVLEIGFGNGYGTGMLADKAARIDALDINAEMVAHASQAYPLPNGAFTHYDGHHLPFEQCCRRVDAFRWPGKRR